MITHTSHSPFPVQLSPWIMTQTWNDVLFIHFQVDPDELRDKVPKQLTIDTYNGMARISLVAFNVTNFRGRLLPPIPFAHSFPELNVRTYVTVNGKPSVYFFSLDAWHRLAVLGARTFFHLPYFYARQTFEKVGDTFRFSSKRESVKGAEVECLVSYRPISTPFSYEKGSLDYWLTERYRLYTAYKHYLYYVDIHHTKWVLQRAEATIEKNTAISSCNLTIAKEEPLLHYAKQKKALFWPLKREIYVN
ncbi:DUF2071 domain-containing protein [bacterium LRH843]|nr:DUF2071 domain-containing protein [bacterium LRH843]